MSRTAYTEFSTPISAYVIFAWGEFERMPLGSDVDENTPVQIPPGPERLIGESVFTSSGFRWLVGPRSDLTSISAAEHDLLHVLGNMPHR